MFVSLKKQAAYYIIKVRNATDLHLFQFCRIFPREWRWLDFNCISSGHELLENIKLFIYYSFLFVCLFVCFWNSSSYLSLSCQWSFFFMILFVSHFRKGDSITSLKISFLNWVRYETLTDCSFFRKITKHFVLVLILLNSCCVALLMTTLLN